MTELIFFGTFITLLVYVVRLIVQLIKQKSVARTCKTIAVIVIGYAALLGLSYGLRTDQPVPLSTDICFDDWCATVTHIEKPVTLGADQHTIKPQGQFIVLYVRMSNHAKRIAQRPSEPRVHIIDGNGIIYSTSFDGQQALEQQKGAMVPLDARLELYQSLETEMVFDIPLDAQNLSALLEEGPFIGQLIFQQNRQVFLIPEPQ